MLLKFCGLEGLGPVMSWPFLPLSGTPQSRPITRPWPHLPHLLMSKLSNLSEAAAGIQTRAREANTVKRGAGKSLTKWCEMAGVSPPSGTYLAG